MDQFFHDQKTGKRNSLTSNPFIGEIPSGKFGLKLCLVWKSGWNKFANCCCWCTELNIFVFSVSTLKPLYLVFIINSIFKLTNSHMTRVVWVNKLWSGGLKGLRLCAIALYFTSRLESSERKQSNPPSGERRGGMPPFLGVSWMALRNNVEFPHYLL